MKSMEYYIDKIRWFVKTYNLSNRTEYFFKAIESLDDEGYAWVDNDKYTRTVINVGGWNRNDDAYYTEIFIKQFVNKKYMSEILSICNRAYRLAKQDKNK